MGRVSRGCEANHGVVGTLDRHDLGQRVLPAKGHGEANRIDLFEDRTPNRNGYRDGHTVPGRLKKHLPNVGASSCAAAGKVTDFNANADGGWGGATRGGCSQPTAARAG